MKTVLALLLLLLSACASTQAEPLVREALSTDRCALTGPAAEMRLIETRAAWRSIQPQDAPSILAKEPDWRSESVLILSNGPRPTPGYRLHLRSSAVEGEQLLLRVEESRPAAGAFLSQVLTQPCLILRLGKQGWRTLSVDGTQPPLRLPAR